MSSANTFKKVVKRNRPTIQYLPERLKPGVNSEIGVVLGLIAGLRKNGM